MKKYLVVLFLVFSFSLAGCGRDDKSGSDSCTSISNSLYHINYFEMCGNSSQPVTIGTETSVALWFEVDSPNSATGKVWIDDLYLERSDQPGVNMASNASFSGGLWQAKNNAMCLASNTWCQGLVESDDYFVWQLDNLRYYSGSYSAVADMSRLGMGYQTHMFQLMPFNNGIPAGITFKAHAMIWIEGGVQARLGVDLRDSNGIRAAVNGIVVRGDTNGWRRINLR